MTESIDPYHKWLGIPPELQPPNHYRLLGIDDFEDDREVIERAADRQMAHIRTYQAGQHVAASQKILNEITGAKLCLLSREKKRSYDAELRAHKAERAAASERSVPAAKPHAPASSSRGASIKVEPDPQESATNIRPAPRSRLARHSVQGWRHPAILAAAGASSLLVLLLVMVLSGSDGGSPDLANDDSARGPGLIEPNPPPAPGAPDPSVPETFDPNIDPSDKTVRAASLPGVVIDNKDGIDIGNWRIRSPKGERFVGSDYFIDNGSGGGDVAVRFALPVTLAPGWYEVRISYPSGADRASNLKVEVGAADGVEIVTVNQRQAPEIDGLFHSLGRYRFDRNGRNSVVITNDGADGTVVVDAVQFVPTEAP